MANGGVLCWGWSGTAWVKLLVDALGRLQVDVNVDNFPADYPLPAAQIALLQAVTVGNFPATYPLSAAQVASLQQVTEQGTPSVHLYGYDTANWQTLLVEDDTNFNLRVKLYDGATGIDSDVADFGTIPTTFRGLGTMAVLYGNDGVTNSPLKVDSALYPNLRVSLWYLTRQLNLEYCNADNVSGNRYHLNAISRLMGFDGTNWDRLRTYGTGILKVGDAVFGDIYSKTMTMADDNPTRFEAAAKNLRDVVIIVKTHPMLLGETGVVVYPVGAGETIGFTKVDISTLYFQNASAGDNGVITILGVEE